MITGTWWQETLAELESHRLNERHSLRKRSERVNHEDTQHWPLTSICMCMHLYTHVHVHRNMMYSCVIHILTEKTYGTLYTKIGMFLVTKYTSLQASSAHHAILLCAQTLPEQLLALLRFLSFSTIWWVCRAMMPFWCLRLSCGEETGFLGHTVTAGTVSIFVPTPQGWALMVNLG